MLRKLTRDATVAFLSPCGWGNLGDAAIVDSLIHGIRRRLPDARIVGFTLNPEDTRRRHGVEAHTCAAYSMPFYPVREPGQGAPAEAAGQGPASGIRELLQRLPIRGALRTALLAPIRVRAEPAHLRISRDRLRGARALVVAGGGQLDATWGGFLGHPYVLWRWGRLARDAGAAFYVASVGTGTLPPMSRLLVRRALRLAEYRSYRDLRSRELLGDPALTRDDPIVPDLAYGLPVSPSPPPARERLVVGISPMNFAHPKHWPESDAGSYRRHVASFGDLAGKVAAAGHDAVLFTTDTDAVAMADTLAAIRTLPAGLQARIRVAQTPTVATLFETLAGVDAVVAARLHGVLLAHVAHRPVLAISHERKVRTLMDDLGQSDLCIDIAEFSADEAWSRLQGLLAQRARHAAQVGEFVRSSRERVERQYDALFTPSA